MAAGRRPAVSDIDDAVHGRKKRIYVVRRKQHRGLELPRHPPQQGDDSGYAAHVQIGEGFVQQQQARPPDQGMRDEHPLLLATGEAADPLIGERSRLHRFQHLIDLPPPRPRRQRHSQPIAVEAERDEITRAHRHVGIEHKFLRHVADRGSATAVHGHAAARRRNETEDCAQKRRFSGPVGADQTAELAGVEGEVDILENSTGRRARRMPVGPREPRSSPA